MAWVALAAACLEARGPEVPAPSMRLEDVQVVQRRHGEVVLALDAPSMEFWEDGRRFVAPDASAVLPGHGVTLTATELSGFIPDGIVEGDRVHLRRADGSDAFAVRARYERDLAVIYGSQGVAFGSKGLTLDAGAFEVKLREERVDFVQPKSVIQPDTLRR